ncbi:MAG: sugar phosphate isomerase/epimerase family protein [Cyclobacteriaceae bacterium]
MHISRRKFTKLLATYPALAALSSVACQGSKNAERDFGIITFTIKEPIKSDFEGTIAFLSEVGYRKLEFGSFEAILPEAEARNILKDHGLKPVSGGGSIADLQNDFDKQIQLMNFYEKEYMICYWPWHGGADDKTADDFKKVAEAFNILGEKCKQEGFKFAFHNHNQEFVKTGENQLGYDILLNETDANLVHMELDVYWAKKGNADPIAYMENYPDRFHLLHLKDMDDTAEGSFEVVGDGIIDFGKVLSTSDKIGVKHLIVEHDAPADPMYCARRSIEHLKSLS